ncbi:MAG: hypothetical protein ACKO7D_07565, partial [Bacteroidota bacterium]
LTVPVANAGADGTITCTQNTTGVALGASSVTGVTYAWTPSTGLSATNVSNPTSTTTTTTTYTLTATNSTTGCTATDLVIVTVDKTPPTVNAGDDFTKTCIVNPSGAPIGTASTVGYTYSWSPALGLSSTTTSNPTANPSTTTTYTVTVTNSSNGCTATDQVIVTVNTAAPTVTAGSDLNVCSGAQTTLSASGADSYSWNNGILNNTPFNATTTTTYTVTGTNSVNGCQGTDNVIVTVFADPAITTQPLVTQTICVGGTIPTPLTVAHSGGTGSVTYQWYLVGTPNQAILGAITSSFTPTTFNTPGTFIYYTTVNYTGSGCDAATSAQATISVLADPAITVASSATYCQNSASVVPLSATATGGNNAVSYTYQWYSNNTNSTTGATSISGATNSTYLPPVNTVGPTYYYCIVSQSSANCSGTSNIIQVEVTAPPTITTQPQASQNLCVGGTPTNLTVGFSNGTSSESYQWYSNTTNNTAGGTLISGATSQSYTPPSSTAGTVYYYCVISFSTGGCSSVTSNVASVIVNPDPVVTTQPLASQTICVGGTLPSPLSFSNTGGTGTATYQWYLVGPPNQAVGTNSTTFTPSNFSTAGTYNYFAQISYSGSGCESVNTANATIVVVNDPVVSIASSEIYCQNSTSVSAIGATVTGGFGTTNYAWYSNNTNNNTGGTLISSVTSSTYTPPVSSIGTTYYYSVVNQTGTNCSSNSPTVSIQVIAQPQITSQPISTQTVCVGGTLSNLTVSHTNGVT